VIVEPVPELFPPSVIVVGADEAMWQIPALAAEEAFIRNAVEKRQRSFRAGRACAHRALARLGLAETALLVGPHGAPLWPEGIIGSISHCSDRCLAAVARGGPLAGIGLDVERWGEVKSELAGLICRPEERAWISEREGDERSWLALFFSAKESVYKCVYPILQEFIEFHEVRILPDEQRQKFAVAFEHARAKALDLANRIEGRFAFADAHLYTSAYVTAG
jgi:4'-phosphopantetheinyl transferase EntD